MENSSLHKNEAHKDNTSLGIEEYAYKLQTKKIFQWVHTKN